MLDVSFFSDDDDSQSQHKIKGERPEHSITLPYKPA